MTTQKVVAPAAPEILPADLRKEWQKRYLDAFEGAQSDEPEDQPRQRMIARREANRMLRTAKLTCIEDAERLPGWQVLDRGERTDPKTGAVYFGVVTIDGKKYRFPATSRRAAAKPSADNDPNADQGSNTK